MSITARRVMSARPGVEASGKLLPRQLAAGPRSGTARVRGIVPPRSARTGTGASLDSLPRTLHGTLLRDLRQSFDGRFQPPIIWFQPGSRASPHGAEPAAADGGPERRRDEGDGLHAVPPDRDEERSLESSAASKANSLRAQINDQSPTSPRGRRSAGPSAGCRGNSATVHPR